MSCSLSEHNSNEKKQKWFSSLMAHAWLFLFFFIRQMLGDERFLKFVQENPQVNFQTELKGARHPVLIGDYSKLTAFEFTNNEADLIF